MKTFIQTIVVLVALNLATGCSASAQSAPAPTPPNPNPPEAVEAETKQVQMEAAREQVEADRAQMETAREQMEAAKSMISLNLGMSLPHSGGGTVLVIPTSKMKTEDLATIIEDMTVMARIIDKQLGKEETKQMRFFGDFLGQRSQVAETIYLQGYGALFLKEVDFPLSPSPKAPEEEQIQEDIDPIWDQTKREIYEPDKLGRHKKDEPEKKYDAEKVETLKRTLTQSLKHAANIRNLRTKEWVIITVSGGGQQHSKIIKYKIIQHPKPSVAGRGGVYGGYGAGAAHSGEGDFSENVFPSATVLTIRVRKSDVDAFAKGELDFDKFRQRVQIFTY